MNKTILNLNYKKSIVIISILGIVLGFLSNAYYVKGIIGLISYIFRFILFVGVYLVLHMMEKNNLEFKETSKRMLGYLAISSSFNLICAIFSATNLLSNLFISISGVVCFWLIVAFIIEILNMYLVSNILKKILNINKIIGLAIANPIIRLFTNKTTNG